MKLVTILEITAVITLAIALLPAVSLAETIVAMGTVTDANGDPLAGANVTLLDDSFRVLAATTTDANGSFHFTDVQTAGSSLVKPRVTCVRDGFNYSTHLENIQWYDASGGPVSFSINDLRLYEYPPSDHGYVWGVIMDSPVNGKALDGTVYLTNGSVTLTTEAGGQGSGFLMEVSPGTYEVMAVHKAGNYSQVSNRTTITIAPAYDYMQSAPITLIADRQVANGSLAGIPTATATLFPPVASLYPTPGTTPTSLPSSSPVPGAGAVKIVPLAAALLLGALFGIAGWALLRRT